MNAPESTGRIIALDIGTVRIGVAASDPTGLFAQGVCVLRAAGQWMDELADIITEYGAGKILVGMPRRTDGSEGPEAAAVRKILARLEDRFPGMEMLTWEN